MDTNVGAPVAEEASEVMDLNKALRLAAEKGDEAECRRLLAVAEVDAESVDPADEKSFTALHLAARAGHEAVCRLLIEKNPKAMSSARGLYLAALHGREGVCQLLSAGKSPAELVAPFKVIRLTALHAAAISGQEAICRLLLDKGAEVDSVDSEGRAPLWFAAFHGHEAVCRLLLERGAEVTLRARRRGGRGRGRGGTYALAAAAYEGHVEICRLLLGHGAGLEDGAKSALNMASRMGHEDVCKLLVGLSDEWKSRKQFLTACLNEAASAGHAAVCRLLMDSGAGYEEAISAAVGAHRIEAVEALVLHEKFDPERVPAVRCDGQFLSTVMQETAELRKWKSIPDALKEIFVQLGYAVRELPVPKTSLVTTSNQDPSME